MKLMMRATLPWFSFGLLVIGAGAFFGMHTDRWRSTADLDQAVSRLDLVPATLGDWQGKEMPFDAEDLKRAGIMGHASYQYRNIVTGQRVSLLIVCGRFGPISVHTPDICYAAAGFRSVGDAPSRKTIPLRDGQAQSVWAMKFNVPATSVSQTSQVEVSWVWNGGKGWVAPENSRWTFSGYPVLYKLYVVRDIAASGTDAKNDASVSFLQAFLPRLEEILSR
jgi:hypothetical protein